MSAPGTLRQHSYCHHRGSFRLPTEGARQRTGERNGPLFFILFGDKDTGSLGSAGVIRQHHFFIVGIKQLRVEIILRQDITVAVSVVAKAISNIEIHHHTIYTISLCTGFVAVVVLFRHVSDVINNQSIYGPAER